MIFINESAARRLFVVCTQWQLLRASLKKSKGKSRDEIRGMAPVHASHLRDAIKVLKREFNVTGSIEAAISLRALDKDHVWTLKDPAKGK